MTILSHLNWQLLMDAPPFFPPSHDNMLDTTMNAHRGPANQPHQLTHAVLMVTSDSPNVGASVI